MDVRNMKRVARRIKANPEKYNQGNWCGSTACVAGHAFFEAGGTTDKHGEPVLKGAVRDIHVVPNLGREFLGLDEDFANKLFMESWPGAFNQAWLRYGDAGERLTDQDRANAAHDYLMHLAKDHQRKLKAARDKRYRARLKARTVFRHDEEGESAYAEHTNPYTFSRYLC